MTVFRAPPRAAGGVALALSCVLSACASAQTIDTRPSPPTAARTATPATGAAADAAGRPFTAAVPQGGAPRTGDTPDAATSAAPAPFASSTSSVAPDPSASPALSASSASPPQPAAPPDGEPWPASRTLAGRADVDAYARMLAQQHGFDAGAVQALLDTAVPSAAVLRLIDPRLAPPHRKVWTEYRSRFIEPVRIRRGREFMATHARTLARAERTEGVPAEIIASIIGVETVYGRQTGNFRVLDALSTLAFDYPPRAGYFRGELTQFLLYARENGLDPAQVQGSYAGAIGVPQFMPTSIRSYAQDFDGDQVIDLRRSEADAIGSVARFLRLHGWQSGVPTHYRARVADEARAAPALARGPEPRDTIDSLRALGVDSPDAVPPAQPLLLVDLVNADAPAQYVLGTQNFYAITRYNRSYFYAMAVIELAAELRAGAPAPVRTAAATTATTAATATNAAAVTNAAATANAAATTTGAAAARRVAGPAPARHAGAPQQAEGARR